MSRTNSCLICVFPASLLFGFPFFLFLFLFFDFRFFVPSLVSSHSGRPPKYSSVSELGHHQHYHHLHHHPLVTPATTGSHLAPPAPRGPDCSGGPAPLPVHPHTLPLPNPSAGDVSSSCLPETTWRISSKRKYSSSLHISSHSCLLLPALLSANTPARPMTVH